MKEHGADVREGTERVRFDADMILELIKHCPSEFTLHARNPAHNVRFGGNNLIFSQMASAPNCSDLDNGRRPGNQADFRNFLKLAQMHNILMTTGGYPGRAGRHPPVGAPSRMHPRPVDPDRQGVPHLFARQGAQCRRHRDRPHRAAAFRREQLQDEPSVYTIINTNSPLKLDIPMMEGIIQMSGNGQLVIVTPFTLAGAMAPVTVAGALVQQNAEALAGIAFAQMVKKGAPVGYGGFTSNVDMKSGAPAFGTPEYMKAQIVGGQLARRYGIPYRTSNVCAANQVDAQAAYESVFSLWGAIQCGLRISSCIPPAGWKAGCAAPTRR